MLCDCCVSVVCSVAELEPEPVEPKLLRPGARVRAEIIFFILFTAVSFEDARIKKNLH